MRKTLLSAFFFPGLFRRLPEGPLTRLHPDDSPETIIAGATLSIQHPPGYPLHSLLGRPAVLALPGSRRCA